MSTPLLRVDGLHLAFGDRQRQYDVVRGVDLRIAAGEILGLLGESGSGKSLTAMAVMGLLPPGARISSGRIEFDGVDLVGLRERAMNRLRGRAIGMIFQEPLSALNPVIPVGQQIVDNLRTHATMTRRAAQARVVELLDLVGISHPAERARAYAHELSGGMRQRVLTALAIASNPKLLIADEPTTALDVTVQAQIIAMLDRLRRDLGLAILFISHNLELVRQICDRVCVMYAGRIVESGAVDPVFDAPHHPYTRQLLRCVPRLDGSTGRMPTIPGLPPRLGTALPGCAFASRCAVSQPRCLTHAPPTQRENAHLSVCWEGVA